MPRGGGALCICITSTSVRFRPTKTCIFPRRSSKGIGHRLTLGGKWAKHLMRARTVLNLPRFMINI